MRTPPLLLGATLLFWGWQSGYLWVAAILAGILEGSRLMKARWSFRELELNRIWDFCAVMLVGALLYALTTTDASKAIRDLVGSPTSLPTQTAALNQTVRVIFALVQWLPMLLFPFMAAQAFSQAGTMPLSTVSWLLRTERGRAWRPAWATRAINVSFPYFAVCLTAACVGRPEGHASFVILGCLVAWGLWGERSRRFPIWLWLALASTAMALSYVGGQGLEQLYARLQSYNPDWLTRRVQGGSSAKESRTALGSIGRLKLSSRIVYRVRPHAGHAVPALLREASYALFRSPTWYGAGAPNDFQTIEPDPSESSWPLLPRQRDEAVVTIAGLIPGGRGLLPLANRTVRLDLLSATDLRTNRLGAVLMETGPGYVEFDDVFGAATGIDSPPMPDDLQVPEREAAALTAVSAELRLDPAHPQESLRALAAFFQAKFSYRLELSPLAVSATNQTPLGVFLLKDRAGHCELFATASALLLRQAGLPARYAVGYSVQEKSRREFLVRERHAHAWCLVHYAGAWHDFDPTPASWFETDARQASPWEFLTDAWSRLWFEFTRLRYGQSELRRYLLWLVFPLAALFLWQVIRGRPWKRIRASGTSGVVRPDIPGLDSEFFALERFMAGRGCVRRPEETMSDWLRRGEFNALPSSQRQVLAALLGLHQRYRFDPAGLTPAERQELRTRAQSLLEALREANSAT